MTIEQYLKLILKPQLSNKLTGYNVLLCLDISEKTITEQNDIIFQIKTGSSTLSTYKGINEKTTPSQVYFKCLTNEIQYVLSGINELINDLNAETFTTNDNTLNLQLLFTTPSIIATQDETIKNDTFSISYGMFTINTYSTDLPIEPYDKFITIDNVEMAIDNVVTFTDDCLYNYAYSSDDTELGTNKFQSKSITYTLSFLKTNNEFSNFLDTNKYTLKNKVVTLTQKDNGVVKSSQTCIITQITIAETQGIPTVTMLLKGV